MYFLRFTSDPNRDIEYGTSLWVDWNDDDPNQDHNEEYVWVDDYECWCKKHSGLSGHALDADTLEEAIEETKQGRWFGNPNKDSWAIFEGDFADEQDTPEGDTFIAESAAHFVELGGLSV